MPQTILQQVEAARKEGYSDNEILQHLSQSRSDVNDALNEGYSSKEIIDFISKPKIQKLGFADRDLNAPVEPKIEYDPTKAASKVTGIRAKDWRDTLRDYGLPTTPEETKKVTRPILSGVIGTAIGGLATPATTPAGGIAIGSAAAAIVDEYLKNIYGEKPSTSILGSLAGTGEPGQIGDIATAVAENTIMNELGGRAIQAPLRAVSTGIGNVIREASSTFGGPVQRTIGNIRDKALSIFGPYLNPKGLAVGKGTVVKDSILDFAPTYSQLKQSGGGRAEFASLIEDLFARPQKEDAVENSTKLALRKAEKITSAVAGRTLKSGTTKEVLGSEVEDLVTSNIKASYEASKITSEALQGIAEVTTKTIQSNTVSINPITGQFSVAPPITVKGPTYLTNTLIKAKQILDDVNRTLTKPDPELPIVKYINELFEATKANFDPKTGKLISYDPVDFGTSWNEKQKIGRMAFGDPLEGINAMDARLSKLYHSIDGDIEQSIINQWGSNSSAALKLWNKTKQIVKTRTSVFNPAGEEGKSVKDLLPTLGQLRNVNAPVPIIDNIINDPRKLSRLLISGNKDLLRITGKSSSVYAPTNLSQDLKAYQFMSLYKKAWTGTDPTDLTKGVLNSKQLADSFTDFFNSPSGKLLYSSRDRANIGQFVKDSIQVSQSSGLFSSGPSRYLTLRLGSGAIQLGAGIASGILSAAGAGFNYRPYATLSGAAILGAFVGVNQLGKLLTNPETARILIAMQRGGPLTMSHQMAARRIAHVLRGSTITFMTPNGESQARINQRGEIVPVADVN